MITLPLGVKSAPQITRSEFIHSSTKACMRASIRMNSDSTYSLKLATSLTRLPADKKYTRSPSSSSRLISVKILARSSCIVGWLK